MAGFSRTRLVLVVTGLAALGCGGGGDDGGTTPPSTAIAKASNSGDAQTGVVGQALVNPLRVVVTDGGAPAVGATVAWSTSAATGSMTPASATTDANGIATSSWALGTVSGPQTAQATLSGASGSPVPFTATANPGLPSTLSDAGGNGQSAAVGTQLAAKVQAKVSDEFGNGVPGLPVDWTATGGTVSAATVNTDAAGISGVNVTAGDTPGPITITATEASLSGSPVTFTATATAEEPGPTTAPVSVVNNSFNPSTLTISAGTTVVWTWPSTSQNHNVVPDATGGLPPSSGAPANGPKTYSFRFNAPGTYGYHCTVHGSPGQSMFGVIIVQ